MIRWRNGARCSRGSPITTTRRRSSSKLVRARRDAGLSQTAIAARMGTSQSAVARLERGDADVRLSTLQRYAEALDRHVAFGVVERTGREGSTDDDAAELAGDPLPVPSERPVPERRDPVAVPIVYESGDPLRQLYERRTVVLGGPLGRGHGDTDRRRADEPRRRSSRRAARQQPRRPGGRGLRRARRHRASDAQPTTTCIGRACGTAAAVLAIGTGRRRARPTPPCRCGAPRSRASAGRPSRSPARASCSAERARLAVLLAAATGLTVERVVHELDAGTSSTPGEALAALIDEVATTHAELQPPVARRRRLRRHRRRRRHRPHRR